MNNLQQDKLTPTRRAGMHVGLVALLWGVMVLVVAVIASDVSTKRLETQATQRLNELASKLEIELDKYRTLPRVLTFHPLVEQTLIQSEPDAPERANRLLSRYNDSISSDVVYLMNADGITLASSNWQSEESFVGSNYRFRPYFQKAMQGEPGSYFALGTVSGRRGYYFSYPVSISGQVRGVLVIKVALSALEDRWLDDNFDFLLTDIYGVVFYSSHPAWNYKTLVRLSPEVEKLLEEQRQYRDNVIEPINSANSTAELLNQFKLKLNKQNKNIEYLQVHKDMSAAGWRLFALAPVSLINGFVIWSVLSFTLLFTLVYMIGFSWRRTIEARKQLAATNERLEHRVEERTSELRQSNEQLREIIEKYKQTEQTLKRTQNELIQAGKLAMLGEMAASINHELNQPLAAMRIYTETLQMLARRGETDAVNCNAEEILKLNKMMAKIIGQYKLFARKSAGKTGPVSVTETLSASLAIMDNKVIKMGVTIELSQIDDDLLVMADAVPLEQVLINLLNNSLQAISHSDTPKINVQVDSQGEQVNIYVKDNGPGFSEQELDNIFEPFYTTKGQGLGLGLTISKRIVESFNGVIHASNCPEGGAQFMISLNRHFPEKQA